MLSCQCLRLCPNFSCKAMIEKKNRHALSVAHPFYTYQFVLACCQSVYKVSPLLCCLFFQYSCGFHLPEWRHFSILKLTAVLLICADSATLATNELCIYLQAGLLMLMLLNVLQFVTLDGRLKKLPGDKALCDENKLHVCRRWSSWFGLHKIRQNMLWSCLFSAVKSICLLTFFFCLSR